MGGRERVFRNNYRDSCTKPREGWDQGREVGMAGVERRLVKSKCRLLSLNNNKTIKKGKEVIRKCLLYFYSE